MVTDEQLDRLEIYWNTKARGYLAAHDGVAFKVKQCLHCHDDYDNAMIHLALLTEIRVGRVNRGIEICPGCAQPTNNGELLINVEHGPHRVTWHSACQDAFVRGRKGLPL